MTRPHFFLSAITPKSGAKLLLFIEHAKYIHLFLYSLCSILNNAPICFSLLNAQFSMKNWFSTSGGDVEFTHR